jgi:hypothetical protein
MNKAGKILASIFMGILAFLCLGLWPYIPVPLLGISISIALSGACIMGIRSIWKTKKVEGEGDIFKNRDTLNKE